MRRHLRTLPAANAAFAIAEYIAQPLLLLASVPYLLHRLGVEQYAIWILAGAAVTGGTLLSSGFGDAAIKYIADARGRNQHPGAIVRTLLALNLVFGSAFAVLLWCATPFLAHHVPHLSPTLDRAYEQSLALGAFLLILKSVESVFVCAQRACERYAFSTRIAIAGRIATVAAAVIVVALGRGPVAIMLCTLVIAAGTLVLQAAGARRDLALTNLLPTYDPAILKTLFSFGCFSWLQGLVALFAGQADRLLVGYLLGAQPLAYYSVCVQIAMPIHGIAAAGLQVLFPHLAARLHALSHVDARRKFASAFAINAALVALLAAPVIFGSRFLLRRWLGADFAAHAAVSLSIIACSFALLGLNVSGHFFLMALGRVRLLAFINLAGALAMLAAIAILTPRFGITGAACGRLLYGPITWMLYRPLHRALAEPSPANIAASRAFANG